MKTEYDFSQAKKNPYISALKKWRQKKIYSRK